MQKITRIVPLVVLLATVVAVALAVVSFKSLKREFVPPEDRGQFQVNLEGPEGSTVAYTDGYQRQVEQIVGQIPETDNVFSIVGRGGRANGVARGDAVGDGGGARAAIGLEVEE